MKVDLLLLLLVVLITMVVTEGTNAVESQDEPITMGRNKRETPDLLRNSDREREMENIRQKRQMITGRGKQSRKILCRSRPWLC